MLNRTPRAAAAATAVLLFASLGLAGCSSGSNATITHTPALQTGGGRDTARSGVQAALLIANTTNGIALPGGPTPAGIARRVLAIVNARRTRAATGTSTGACISGQKTSQSTAGTGATTTTTDYYYDVACATLEAEEIILVNTPATPGNTTGSGTYTSYNTVGGIRAVQTLTLTVTTSTATATSGQETFTMTDSAAASPGGTVIAGVGATCVGTPPSATLTCSVAHYGTSASTTTGEVISTSANAGASGGNSTATFTIAFYAGTSLALSQSGVLWALSGGSSFNEANGTYGYTTTGSSGSGTLTFADSLYTYAQTSTLSSTGLSTTIIENPNAAVTVVTPIATANVDVAGTGVLNYADGTSEPISGGLIGF